MAADVDDVSAAPGITRPLAHLQTIEIAQRESRAPTGETLLAGQSASPKIELATTCTKAREIWLSDDFARPLASRASF
jgi:hypothetical protein